MLKKYRPTTPGRRKTTVDSFQDITVQKPYKPLVTVKKSTAGRNFQGKITIRHRGSGHKRFLRTIDFKQDKYDIPAKVASIEYDPNRGARIALLHYKDGEKRYIIAPVDLKTGDEIISSREKIEIKTGNRMLLKYIPSGIMVYNVEMTPGKGGQLARGAGTQIQVMSVDDKYAQLKLPSSEIRMVPKECLATIGQASNPDLRHIRWGKAGRMRHLGIRPTVRGKAMNPVDHPHGGGEGHNPIGLKHPKTPWGKPALGYVTRKKGKPSDRFIVKRRKKRR